MRFRAPVAARVLVPLVVSCALLGAAPAALGQVTVPDLPPNVLVPEETGAEVWDGTYVYSCRDFKIGLWIRSKDGAPEMKLRYRRNGRQAPPARQRLRRLHHEGRHAERSRLHDIGHHRHQYLAARVAHDAGGD